MKLEKTQKDIKKMESDLSTVEICGYLRNQQYYKFNIGDKHQESMASINTAPHCQYGCGMISMVPPYPLVEGEDL